MTMDLFSADELRQTYEGYLACLNAQAWHELGRYVAEGAEHNGRLFGLAGYREMLIEDFREIPDLRFKAEFVVCEPPMISARLMFHCSPQAMFLGLPVNGRTVTFAEHVIYEFESSKIRTVWSLIDTQAIERQIQDDLRA